MKAKPTPSMERLHELFVYDDGKLIWKISGTGIVKGKEAGMVTDKGYRRIKVDGKLHMRHRLVWAYHHKDVPDWIDHADEDKSNDRIENLRPATKVQNGYNISMRSNNRSGVKNVYWASREKKWAVEISIDRQIKRIGYFEDIELASLVALEARNKYHREFASRGSK